MRVNINFKLSSDYRHKYRSHLVVDRGMSKYAYAYAGSYFADLVGTQGSARADNATSTLAPQETLRGNASRLPKGSDFSKFPGKLVL